MKLFSCLLIVLLPISAFSQTTAKVEITFQNAKYKSVEKSMFSKFKKDYKPNSTAQFDALSLTDYLKRKKGDQSYTSESLSLEQIDDTHYTLSYFENEPSVIYINQRPVLITPGDDIKLTYKVILWNNEQFRDTIYAEGEHAENYTFSNFFTPRLIKGDRFPDLRNKKFQSDPVALYDELVNAYSFRRAYYKSFLEKYQYNKEITAYVMRANHIEFLSHAIRLETEMAKNYRVKWPEFSEMVHKVFLDTHFVPKDTNYTYRMEETIYSYFWHLTHIDYPNFKSKQSFDNLLDFISKYPNSFVKDYFIFFMVTEHNETWLKFRPEIMVKVIENIKNPNITRTIAKYKY